MVIWFIRIPPRWGGFVYSIAWNGGRIKGGKTDFFRKPIAKGCSWWYKGGATQLEFAFFNVSNSYWCAHFLFSMTTGRFVVVWSMYSSGMYCVFDIESHSCRDFWKRGRRKETYRVFWDRIELWLDRLSCRGRIAGQDDAFGTDEDISVDDPSIRHFQTAVIEVVYADMTLWQGDGTPWDELKALTPLQEKFADEELVKQYKLQLGADCEYFPTVVKEKKLWTCACGACISMTSGVCHKCQRSYKDMVSPEMLKKTGTGKRKAACGKKREEEEEERKRKRRES